MKSKLVVPRNQAREMVPGPDLDRMLDSGSYLIATKPKKPSAHLIAQKNYLSRRATAGYKRLDILLPEDVYALLLSGLRDGETYAGLVERLLLNSTVDSSDNS